jgi:hypothetical protein
VEISRVKPVANRWHSPRDSLILPPADASSRRYSWRLNLHAPQSATTSEQRGLDLAARILWGVVIGVSILRGLLIHFARHRGIYGIYLHAGQNWLTGQNVYADKDGLDVFRYAPLIAAAMTPLAKVSRIAGSLLFRTVNVSVFMFGAFAFLDRVVQERRGTIAASIYWIILAPLAFNGLTDLQVNALATGLMLLAVAAPPRSKWTLAAVCLMLAVLLKVYPVALMLPCILLWPRQLTGRCIAAMAVGLAAPFLMQHPHYVWDQYHRWFHLMSSNDRQWRGIDDWYRDVRLPLKKIGVDVSPAAYTVLQFITAAWVAVVSYRFPSQQFNWRRDLAILYGMAAGWMMAFGPATEGVTYVMLAPALAWLGVDAMTRPHARIWRVAVWAVIFGFIATEMSIFTPFGRPLRNFGPQGIGAFLVMVFMTLLRWQPVERATLPIMPAEPTM